MKENRKEDAAKTENTSAKEKESRKMGDDDVDQVSGGLADVVCRNMSQPIRPIWN